jgi:putative intracellular protease/amidase
MADWEPGYVIAELHSGRYFKDRQLKFEVMTVSLTKDPIITMGGIKIIPGLTIEELTTQDAAVLILPGGNTWLEPIHAPIFTVVRKFLDAKIPIAAICGATIGLAANGLLDHSNHTSNDLNYLKACCPSYRGESRYIQKPAVTDGDMITASGVAPLEFTCEVLKKLDVFSPATIDAWYNLYKTYEARYYFALIESLPKM